MAEIVNHVREAIMLVDGQGRLLFANPAARRLIAADGPLAARAGRLRCRYAAGDDLLQRAIERACVGGAISGRVLVLQQDGRTAALVTVRCVREAGCEHHALVLAAPLHTEEPGIAASVRDCFGLTPSEAEVAASIGVGRSVVEIARQRRVSVNTIRTQVKRIASKLGCARQSQIALIVNAVPSTPVPVTRIGTELRNRGRTPDG